MLHYTPKANPGQRRREREQYLRGFGWAATQAPRLSQVGAPAHVAYTLGALGDYPSTRAWRAGVRDGLAAGFGF